MPNGSRAQGAETRWPITGRAEELRAVHEALRRSGGQGGVIIAGEAGVGKTRLAAQVLLETRPLWQIHCFHATASAKVISLGVFGAAASDLGADTLSRTERLIRRLALAPPGKRPLIYVDDAHHLDDVSAYVVHQLVQRRAAAVLLTVRTHADCPDAVTSLWKNRAVERIELQPLAMEETRHLLETALQAPIESGSFRRLWDITRGNILYLRQLVDDERAAGRLHQVGTLWAWEGRPAVSPSLTRLIEQRMGRLTGPLQEVVDLLAVAEPLELKVMTDVVGTEALEHAEQQQLLEVTENVGRYLVRLMHPLYGEARRATAGTLRLRGLRGRLADTLAWHGGGLSEVPPVEPQVVFQRALLALESDRPPDAALFTAGARAAMYLLDLSSAERLAHAALLAGGSSATQLTYAVTLVLLGRGADAELVLERLDRECVGAERTYAATVRAANLVWMRGDPEKATQVLRECACDAAARGMSSALHAVEACVHSVLARPGKGAELSAVALADPSLPAFHTMMALAARVQCLGAVGSVTEMEAAAERGFALARREPETSHLRFWFGALLSRAYRLSGHLDRAQEIARRMHRQAEHAAPGLAHAQIALLLGYSALAQGDLESAVRWLEETHVAAELYDASTGLRPAALLWLAEAFAVSGRHAEARQAMRSFAEVAPSQFLFMAAAAELSRAWVLAAEGAVSEAAAAAAAAARDAAARGQHANEVLCLQTATQFGDATAAPRLTELAGLVHGPRACAAADYAVAFARHDGVGLEEASRRFLAMGDKVAALDAMAQAAVVHARGGHNGKAQMCAATAQRIASACGHADTPALRAAAQPVSLTNREREIIHLVAEGLSSRDIAERLTLSIRTIDGHLYHAAQKTGMNTRKELADFLFGRLARPT